MALKDSFATIRFFTAADVYFYTTDNRPLTDAKACLDFLADTLDTGFTSGTITTTGFFKGADGNSTAPSFTFTSDLTKGFFANGTNNTDYAAAGTSRLRFGSSNGFGSISFLNGATIGAFLNVVSANALELSNSTNAQTFRIYNTFTDTSNYERIDSGWSGNTFLIQTSQAGTGTSRSISIGPTGVVGQIDFQTNSAAKWRIQSNNNGSHLIGVTDNTFDIGAAGATRPRSAYLGSRIVWGDSTITYSASMTPDVSLGNNFTISATNSTAFTINAPTNPTTGQFVTITIRNTSGGALGVATWNAAFKMTAWTQPANTNSRSIQFKYDGTNWIEINRSAADVPN